MRRARRQRGGWAAWTRWALSLSLVSALIAGTSQEAAAADRPAGPHPADVSWVRVARVSAISADGRIVTYAVDSGFSPSQPAYIDFVTDVATGSTVRLTRGDRRGSYGAGMTADGRFLVVNRQKEDKTWQLLVCHRVDLACTRADVDSAGHPGNGTSDGEWLSGNGRYLAFDSTSSDLVPGDTNHETDVFVRDLWSGTTTRVNLGPGGRQANGQSGGSVISANGRYVAFESWATNLVPGDTNHTNDVFVRDVWTGTTTRVNLGPGGRQANSTDTGSFLHLSADGRYVVFYSYATNLVAGDTNRMPDVFVRDRRFGTTHRVSVGPGGRQANGGSLPDGVSADGRYVTFSSDATNLVAGDTNGMNDAFVRDLRYGTTRRVSLGAGGRQADQDSGGAVISADGRYVAFASWATNLVPGDTNTASAAFVRDLWTHATRRVSPDPTAG